MNTENVEPREDFWEKLEKHVLAPLRASRIDPRAVIHEYERAKEAGVSEQQLKAAIDYAFWRAELDQVLSEGDQSAVLGFAATGGEPVQGATPATRPLAAYRANVRLVAAGASTSDQRSEPPSEEGKEGPRFLGRVPIQGDQYELWADCAGVFLLPSPVDEFRFFELDGRPYPLQRDERRPGRSLIQGLTETEIREVIDDRKDNLDSHTFGLRP